MSANFYANAKSSAETQLVEWFNQAGLSDGQEKAQLLRKASEILIHQSSDLLPEFLDNILSYYCDRSGEVKKQIITFIEDLCKHHPEHIVKVITQLRLMLDDSVVAIQKRVIQATSTIYKHALSWLCAMSGTSQDMVFVWEQLNSIKLQILNMIDSDNEGIRTNAIKFLESVIILQTYGENEDINDFSLDDIPPSLSFIKKEKLEEESEHIFTLLIKFHNSQHISSVNLMACMTGLCNITKVRPKFMPRVIQALADLHTTLPPTLSQSQVNSVRKHLKMLLVSLVKHPSSYEMLPHLTQLLADVGMTNQEIAKIVPKERRGKRMTELRNGEGPAKRPRIENLQGSSQSADKIESIEEVKKVFDEEIIFDCLSNIDKVVNLIMSVLSNNLPEEMPQDFTALYKPIPNAGSVPQKRHLSRLLSALVKGEPLEKIISQNVKSSLSEITAKIPLLKEDDDKVAQLQLKSAVAKLQETEKLESAVSRLMQEQKKEKEKEIEKEKQKLVPPQTPTVPKLKQKVQLLKLQEITRPIPKEIKERILLQAIQRILNAEKESYIGGAAHIRSKLITTFASSYIYEIREVVIGYILEDPAGRIELALNWLYEEYALMQGFNRIPVTLTPKTMEKHDLNYNNLLCALITQIAEAAETLNESVRENLLRRIYLESPLISEEAVDYLKHMAGEDSKALFALELFDDMVVKRPPRAHKYMMAMLTYAVSPIEEVRDLVIKAAVKNHQKGSEAVRRAVEKYASLYLGFIALRSPPRDLFVAGTVKAEMQTWTDDLYKLCLNLVAALLPVNDGLLMEVARVYGQADGDGKRCVLRALEAPLREMAVPPASEALLRALDECPRGAETLLTRLVHILTEKAPPSPELVSRVRTLYATRVSDVRFLIPVLNGLNKKEIIAALPKLIKLNPVIVKEVFNKLLGLTSYFGEELPITSVELLVALHQIDPATADLKYIIKATGLCFAEKHVYSEEVLAVVLSRLVEEPEIPVLMMRSVLQAISIHPNLLGVALNIMQRLIEKEVWTNKIAWEGWIKCAERTAPGSLSVALSLPAAALTSALQLSPALAARLEAHVAAMTPAQHRLLAPHVLTALTHRHYQEAYNPAVGTSPGNPTEPLPPGME